MDPNINNEFDQLGPVEPIVPELRKSFDQLMDKYLSYFIHLPYFEEMREIIFSDLIILLKSCEKHYIPERGESIKYFIKIMEKRLCNTVLNNSNNQFDLWKKEAKRQYNLNQMLF